FIPLRSLFFSFFLHHPAPPQIYSLSLHDALPIFLGSTPFLALYLLCGIFGSLASTWWNPYVVSAGASGAVFGCYGILIGFLLRSRGTIPQAVLNRLLRGAFVFIGYNVIYGLQPGIDMAGHFGGLVSGFLFRLRVAGPLHPHA